MSVPVFQSISGVREALRFSGAPRAAQTIALVPTMGALHAGHARLIQTARAQSDCVAVSIFVNPTQFDRQEDYERYARTLPEDLEVCAQAGASLVFAPSAAEMYPRTGQTAVDVHGVTAHFCGATRPGHFRGVTTVVAKLFNIVQPQLGFFGEKDAQQLAAIARMVEDLNFPVRIVPVETVREPDGLAMSSRNARLTAPERERAVQLYLALLAARDRIAHGERDSAVILDHAVRELAHPDIRIDYLGLADPATLQPVERVTAPVRAMGAVFIGGTRLIDNMLCVPPGFPASTCQVSL